MADKDFGVKRINLVGAAGTPTITSPTDLIINANKVAISTNTTVGGSIGIGTTNPTSKLWVGGDGYFVGVVTANKFVGALDATSAQAQSVGFATTATNLAGGSAGNIPFQNSPGITSFLDGASVNNQVLLYDTDTNKPKWGNVSAGEGAFSGIDVKDEDSASVSGIKILNIRGDNISAVSDTVSGISTITVASNLVGAALSISGISTFGGSNGVVIKLDGSNGIVTSANPGFSTVTYYGDGSKLTGIGTAASATNVVLSNDSSSTNTNIVFSQTPNQNPTSSLKTNSGLIFNAATSSLGIGTTNPVTNLEVFGNSPILRISGNSGSTTRLDLSSTAAIKWSLVGNPSGSNGALTIQSNDIELIRVSNNTGNVGLGTTNPTSKLWVDGDGYFVGVITANKFVGALDATSAQAQSVGFATTATNLANGVAGNVPYQSDIGITTFVTNGSPGQVLLSNGSGTPYWGNVSAASGSFGGISVQDEGTQVGTGNSITTLNFVGSNIQATATTGPSGIATITISDNLVGTALSISGISTFNTVKISSGIITSTNPGYSTVTYYGNLVGTALTAGYATTAFSLNGVSSGDLNVAYATTAGIATVATKLQTARTISLSNDLGGSATFDGSSDISIYATIQPNSVALSSDTTGDYVQSITGTSNQIAVSVTSGEGSAPVISIPNNPTLPGTTVTIQNDLQVNRNLNVTGNITIGGTTALLDVQRLQVSDPDLVLGVRTDAFGNDVSNDTTANHGGIAIASTEGSPLVNFNVAGIETLPPTYKKIMWFKSGTFAGLGTDAWLFNYAVGIGSTQFPSGTRLAVGSVQFTENDLVSVRNINATGVITATKFVGSVGFATTATNLAGGAQGSLPFQNSSGITTFLSAAGSNNQVLLYDTDTNKPKWGNVSAGEGAFSGITVSDEGTTPYSNITTVDIFGSNITATSGGIGIASIRVSDNLVGTALSISGISTLGTVSISSGIISSTTGTAVTFIGNLTGTASYATTAGIATNLADGVAGNVLYQSSPNTTAFVTNGDSGQVLLSNGSGTPYWGNVSAASGSFGGITVRDEGDLVGTGNSITTLNFVGSNIRATATTGPSGIATITIADNLVGTALSISGISTLGGVQISSGIITSTTGTAVTYYGDGSKLTGLIAGVSIFTNTTNQVQYLTYVTGTGSTTGFGITTTGLVFNPSSGNLGIGTTTPTSKLTVQGDVFVSGFATFSSGLEVTDLLTIKPGQQGSNLFEILDNAQSVVVAVTTTGNLGIGTTTPSEKLWVDGNGYFTGVVTAQTFYGSIDSSSALSQSVGFATTARDVIGGIASVTSLRVSGFATFSSGLEVTDLLTIKPGQQGSNLFEILNDAQDVVVAVTTTGNLGIGTTTPSEKLWVNGNGYFVGVVTANKFYGDGSQLTGLTAGVSISTNTTNQSQFIPYVTGIGTTTGFGITTTGLVFNPFSGNLGIGSTTPTSKLTVQGNVLISGVTTSGITRISSSIASPNASTPVATLEAVGASSNYDIAIVPKGNGAIVASIPDGTSVGGNKRGNNAVDLQLIRSSATQVASGNYSFIGGGTGNTSGGTKTFVGGGEGNSTGAYSFGAIVGGQDNAITGGGYCFIGGGDSHIAGSDYATIAGGSNNTASGQYASILGGGNNTASGGLSFIGGGTGNTSGGTKTFVGGGEGNSTGAYSFGAIVGGQDNAITGGGYCFIGGGDSHTASSDYATIAGGTSNIASGQYSSVLGGNYGKALKNYSSVIGGYGANTRNTYGAVAFAGANTTFGTGSGVGLQQARFAILSKATTDATPSTLTADGNVYDTNNVLQVVTKSAYLVKGSVIAYSNASDLARAWEFTAVVKNTSGTPVLVGTPIINDIAYDSGASGWNLSITADSGTSSLKVEVTGQTSTTIRWVTKIDSTEVAFQ